MNMKINTKRILIFLAFVFGITSTVELALYLTMGKDNLLMAGLLSNYACSIWAPALSNVATRLVTREGWGHLMLRLNFRRGWKFYLAALFLPILMVITGAALYFFIFPQSFDSNLVAMRTQLAAIPFMSAWIPSASPWVVFLALTLWLVIVLSSAYALVSIGEEFGWRAYLLPKLVESFAGASPDDPAFDSRNLAIAGRKAALLVGVIWGVWHIPAHILFSPGTNIVTELLYIVSTCCMSVFLCWVTLRSGSVWPAAVGHGMFNNAIAFPMYSLKGPANALLGSAGGLIGGIGYIAVALVIFFNRKAFARRKEVGLEKVNAVAGA
jgi:membrane protease YdiL (CAAX protease family)